MGRLARIRTSASSQKGWENGSVAAESMKLVTPDLPTILLVNPASRRGGHTFEDFRASLGQSLNLVDAAMTTSVSDMQRRIQTGLNQGVLRFIIGGGDGTISQAADILAGSPGILGVLPLGTGNTFSHGLGVSLPHDELVALMTEGPVVRHDLGLAIKGDQKKAFLNSLTMGFSERLVELLSRERKDSLGYFAWIVEFRRALARTPVMQVRLTWDDGQDTYETRQLLVVNGRTIAAGIAATPASSGQDGLLEVFRLGNASLLSILRLGTKLLTGRLLTDQEAHYRAVTHIAIETDPALPVNIDGEIWLEPPLSCRVLPAALWVITPSAGKHPRRWPLVAQTIAAPRALMPRVRHYSVARGAKRPPRVR